MPRAKALEPSLRSYWSDLPLVTIAARSGAAIEPGADRFPLLVFSHGMNSARYFYTDLLQQLASRGYVVAAIDHSFWSIATAFEDGGVVPLERGIVARDRLSSGAICRLRPSLSRTLPKGGLRHRDPRPRFLPAAASAALR